MVMKNFSDFLLKHKLLIILLLVFLFIGTCHCMKSKDILGKLGNLGKTIEAKKEGFKKKVKGAKASKGKQ